MRKEKGNEMSAKTYMAVDQYGQTIHDLGPYPRKALLEKLDRKHADRMFRDQKDGPTVHVGWIVAGRWFSVYAVEPMRIPA